MKLLHLITQPGDLGDLYSVTHVHEQQLHLVFSDPPPDALPRPEPKGQGTEPCPPSSLALLSAFAPPAGVKA